MAIYKISTARATGHAALMGVLRYVLNEEKRPSDQVAISGHYNGEDITPEKVYAQFLQDKKVWNKDSGRMYTHCIVSFPPDEHITPEEAKEFAEEFTAQAFPGHQALIVTHEDKAHLHCHIVLNSVNYHNGSKLHCTRTDLERQRSICNALCRQHGYSVPEKGKHIDGRDFEENDFIAWDKNKYQALKKASGHSQNDIDIFRLLVLILKAALYSRSLPGFYRYILNHGWMARAATHKQITFEAKETGKKFRTSTIQKTYPAFFRKAFGDDFTLTEQAIQKIVALPDEQRTAVLLPALELATKQDDGSQCNSAIAPFDPERWKAEKMDGNKRSMQYSYDDIEH